MIETLYWCGIAAVIVTGGAILGLLIVRFILRPLLEVMFP